MKTRYIVKKLSNNKYLTIAGYSSDIYRAIIFRNKKKTKKKCDISDITTIIKIYI
jgi:hypothetical protein